MFDDCWSQISRVLVKIVEDKTLPRAEWISTIQLCCQFIRLDDQYPVSVTENIRGFTKELILGWENKLKNAQCGLLAIYADIFWQFYLFCRQLCDLFFVNMRHIIRLRNEFKDQYDNYALDRVLLLQWKSIVLDTHIESLMTDAFQEIKKGFLEMTYNPHVVVFVFSLIAVDNSIDLTRHISYEKMLKFKETAFLDIFKEVKKELIINSEQDYDEFEDDPFEYRLIYTNTYAELFVQRFEKFFPEMTEYLINELYNGTPFLSINQVDKFVDASDNLYDKVIYGNKYLTNYIYDRVFFRNKTHYQDLFYNNINNENYEDAFNILRCFERNPEVLVDLATFVRQSMRNKLDSTLREISTTIPPVQASHLFVSIVEEMHEVLTQIIKVQLNSSNTLLSSIDNAISDVINDYTLTIGSLSLPFDALSLFVDDVLSKNWRNRDVDVSFSSTTILMICLIRNQLSFFQKYVQNLFERLQKNGFQMYNSLELDTANRLKTLCGKKNLELVIDFINAVEKPTRKEYMESIGVETCCFYPFILPRINMPDTDEIYISVDRLPAEMMSLMGQFKVYYCQVYKQSKIDFVLNYGSVELDLYDLNGQSVSLVVNVSQAAILMLMGDRMSFEELCDLTALGRDVLFHFCRPLIEAGILCISASGLSLCSVFQNYGEPQDCRPTEVFKNSSNKVRKTDDEAEKKWRVWVLSTFIARYLKQNHTVDHQTMWDNICESWKHMFVFFFDDFKQALEHLIDRDIIGRVNDTYLYNP